MSSHMQHVTMLLTVRHCRTASAESGQSRDAEVWLLQGREESVISSESVSGGPQGLGAPALVEATGPGASRGADGHGGNEAPAVGDGSKPGVDPGVCVHLHLPHSVSTKR